MPFEELGIDVILSRRYESGVLNGLEVLCIIILSNIGFESDGEDDTLIIGKTNESLVEGLVV